MRRPNWLSFRTANYDAAPVEQRAIERLKAICPEFAEKGEILDFDFTVFTRPGNWYYPREPIMSALAWAKGFDNVAVAWNYDDFCGNEDYMKDESRTFTKLFESGTNFRFFFPIWNLSRVEEVEQALAAGASEEFLVASVSCVTPPQDSEYFHCGRCEGCMDRWVCFKKLGIEDPSYACEPDEEALMKLITERRMYMVDWMDAYRASKGIPDGEMVVV